MSSLHLLFRRPVPAVLVAAMVILTAGLAAAAVTGGAEAEPVREAADTTGADPFTEAAAEPVPIQFETLAAIEEAADAAVPARTGDRTPGQAERDARIRIDAVIKVAKRRGVPVSAPASPAGAPIYGGSGHNACDPEALIAFLESHPAHARAWAGVQGINPDEIADYVRGLTPGWLLADTEVTNHGFVDDDATPRAAILEAGTAVLVDDQGVPRARCRCGNPLLPALSVHDGTVFPSGDRSFADRVAAAHASPEVRERYRRAESALGVPDGSYEHSFSTGTATRTCEFRIDVEFVDNRLVAGPGGDLRIFETGHVEPSDIFISTDGVSWRPAGRVKGATDELDIDRVADDSDEFRFVRICDAPDPERSGTPGADIDAIGAINSVDR